MAHFFIGVANPLLGSRDGRILSWFAGWKGAPGRNLRTARAGLRVLGPIFSLLWPLSPALAQGTIGVLNTGHGQALITEVRSVLVDAAVVQPGLRFNYGFGTDETVAPGIFLDSFTVTIQNSNQLFTAVYLTADASGKVLAPATPGALPIDSTTIATRVIAYSSLEPVFAHQQAFEVTAAIPPQFLGGQINVFFDLFDNLDPQGNGLRDRQIELTNMARRA